MQMLEAEICNTAIAKQDVEKVKSLISKIDANFTRDRGEEQNSSKSTGYVDKQTKFSSSSKVVVSKYQKPGTGLSTSMNVYDSAKSGSMFAHKLTENQQLSGSVKDTQKADRGYEFSEEPESDSFGNDDDIDEYIRRHLNEEKSAKPPDDDAD